MAVVRKDYHKSILVFDNTLIFNAKIIPQKSIGLNKVLKYLTKQA